MKVMLAGNNAEVLLRFRRQLILEFVGRGVEVVLFAPSFGEDQMARAAELGARAVSWRLDRTSLGPLVELRALIELGRVVRSERPAVLYGFMLKPALYSALVSVLRRRMRVVSVLEGLGFVFTERATVTVVQRAARVAISLAMACSLRLASIVVVLNADDEVFVRGSLGIPRRKARLISGIGVDLSRFAAADVPGGEPVFLYVGRMLRDKGVDELLGAARLLKLRGIRCRIVLAGPLDENPSSVSPERLFASTSSGDVEWLGQVDDIPSLMKSCHVFVLPSYREGMPVSTLEAMSTGRAVITTDVPGCRETVVHGLNGLLVRPRDSEALAAAMQALAGDRSVVVQMGQASRAIAEARFDATDSARKFAELAAPSMV